MSDLSPGGGLVFSLVHNVQFDVPPQNIVAMYDHAFLCSQRYTSISRFCSYVSDGGIGPGLTSTTKAKGNKLLHHPDVFYILEHFDKNAPRVYCPSYTSTTCISRPWSRVCARAKYERWAWCKQACSRWPNRSRRTNWWRPGAYGRSLHDIVLGCWTCPMTLPQKKKRPT